MFKRQLPEYLQFNQKQGQYLKGFQITALSPGPLLHDLNAFLDLIQMERIEVSATHRLALKALPKINEQMHMPIETGLKRPQQKSYPTIMALYLLLRASALVTVDASRKKPTLRINEAVYTQWQTLNPTEQFGTLLEAWLLRGNAEIIGERDVAFRGMSFVLVQLTHLYRQIPDEGLTFDDGVEVNSNFLGFTDLDSFGVGIELGLFDVATASPEPGKNWRITHIKRTQFGAALLATLVHQIENNPELNLAPLYAEETEGLFHRLMQPYFPNWQKTPQLPETEFREGTFTFKVSLGSTWHRIEIGASLTLDEFAMTILEAVNFDNDHLYEFIYRDHFGARVRALHPYMDEGPATTEVRVGDVPLDVGQSMTFVFDFGDYWEFSIVLEKHDAERTIKTSNVIDSKGEPPDQYPDSDWF
jgi:hypothetical protein